MIGLNKKLNPHMMEHLSEITVFHSFSIILLVFFLFFANGSLAQPKIGIQAGTNSLNVSGDKPSNSKFKSGGGYQFGLSANFSIAKDVWISFQPGIINTDVNLQFKDRATNLYEDSVGFSFSYFEIPVQFQILTNNQRFYFSSGLEFSNLLRAESRVENNNQDIMDEVNGFNLFLNYGVSYLIPVGKPILFIEARYSTGLVNMTNTREESSYIPRIKLSGWKFQVGLQVPLKSNNEL